VDGNVAMAQRYTKRLADKILIAFHQACDEREMAVASALLDLLERMAKRSPSVSDRRERHVRDSLVAAHERLWHIQHPHGPAPVEGVGLDRLYRLGSRR
jgi:hypothetical protein